MATLLARVGSAAFRHRRIVATAWGLLLAVVVTLLVTVGGAFDDEFTIPGSESQEALDRLDELSPEAAGAGAQIVFVAPEGQTVLDPAFTAAVEETLAEAADVPQVAGVVSPFESLSLSADGRAALAQVRFDVAPELLDDGALDALVTTTEPAERAGLETAVGGNAFGTTGVSVGPLEFIGVGVAVLVLVLTFGSLLAAGMNLAIALAGIAVGMGGLLLASNLVTLSSTAPTLALMIGLAVGIDYTLFILSRHRTQLAGGMPPLESAARAVGTAGSAVVFAGLTVIIALSGLAVVGIPFLTVMGIGAAGTVLVAVLVALTLLPALLGFAGQRLAPRPGSRAARRETAAAENTGAGGSLGARWTRLITARPLVTVLAALAGLLVLALPAPQLELALPDNSAAAEETPQRQAYDLVSEYFGPGLNGPLVVLVEDLDPATAQQTLEDVAVAIAGTPTGTPGEFEGGLDGVLVAQPTPLPGGTAAIVSVIPETGPQDEATHDVVAELRTLAGDLEAQTGAEFAVTGQTAVGIDISERLADALLPFALVVVGLALVLLLLVFRSILVPIKAAVGFLLSVAASFGAVVAVFQWGWLADLLGVPATGPVISFLPIMLMAILFGLAMDYEVFLVSRMREEYVHGATPREAVVTGARHASRVVVAAALIMFSVFASFVTIEDVTVKAIAFGLAVGVLVDAFLVRMTLVPAVLALLGRSAWWLPAWLDRVLPDLDVEGAGLAEEPSGTTTREPATAAR
ncbi:putative drug exporter of the RND superfamily [Blastococcus aggregatus]|uniref:Putative drug exporter of the RND superfamily n=1 Tax=Blastococcus aggregatus TaxID=38502 RepID=A0A285VF93_9ACTN|nr:MMPL family transporter [Blastococcus aggregatus]SOC52238.1 putative drug exporter of the RND superfamily [Blastococcus aggregatus]